MVFTKPLSALYRIQEIKKHRKHAADLLNVLIIPTSLISWRNNLAARIFSQTFLYPLPCPANPRLSSSLAILVDSLKAIKTIIIYYNIINIFYNIALSKFV